MNVIKRLYLRIQNFKRINKRKKFSTSEGNITFYIDESLNEKLENIKSEINLAKVQIYENALELFCESVERIYKWKDMIKGLLMQWIVL